MSKLKIAVQSVYLTWKLVPLDLLLLIGVSFFLNLLPRLIIQVNQLLLQKLEIMTGNFQELIAIVLLLSLSLLVKKLVNDYYHHYYLNYHSLLKFEKKMRIEFFHLTNKLNLDQYFVPEIENKCRRAQYASVNIFRLTQIIIEITTMALGVFIISQYISNINSVFMLLILIAIIPVVLEKIIEVYEKKKRLYEITQTEREEESFRSFFTDYNKNKELTIYRCFGFLYRKYSETVEKLKAINLKLEKKITVISLVSKLIKGASMVGAYAIAFLLYYQQKIQINEFAIIITSYTYINDMVAQVLELGGNFSEFNDMVQPYFDFKEQTENMELVHSDLDYRKDISIENVSYKYNNQETLAVHDVNININAGEKIAIVGQNGSGKTTLTRIVMGLLDPITGAVKVGGKSIRNLCPTRLFSEQSYVPQMHQCYKDKILNNIVFGDNKYKLQDLKETFKKLLLSDYDTLLTKEYGIDFGGIELSGGEKQKVALARGFYRNAAFIVYDESTSAIDPIQEAKVMECMLEYSEKKTMVIVTHRMGIVKYVDRIIVMDSGRVMDIGTHEELLKRCELYCNMWTVQSDIYKEN